MDSSFKSTLPVGAVLNGKEGRYRVREVLWQNDFAVVYLVEEVLSYYKEAEVFVMTELYVRDISSREGMSVVCDIYLATYYSSKNDYQTISKYLGYHARHVGKEKACFETNNTCYHVYKWAGRRNDALYNWEGAFAAARTHEEDERDAALSGLRYKSVFRLVILLCALVSATYFAMKDDEKRAENLPYIESLMMNPEQALLGPPYPESFSFDLPGEKITMILVRGGSFMMGAASGQEGATSDEFPAHEVTLTDYYISKHEVTNNFYSLVMGTGRHNLHPVALVKWTEAWDFIRNLNRITGHTFTLPTEAQWEFAARGGNMSRGYKYSGSDDIREVAVCDTSFAKSAPKGLCVGSLKPNELGIHDMSGNVSEWCYDVYRSNAYSNSERENPMVHHAPKLRNANRRHVCRGGCWKDEAAGCRVSNRSFSEDYAGLRIVMPLPDATLSEEEMKNVGPRFFLGGPYDFAEWVHKYIQYPKLSEEYGAKGRVIVEYKVGKDGRISYVHVVKGAADFATEAEWNAVKERMPEDWKEYVPTIYRGFDMEVMRVIRKSPVWLPALKDGSPVPAVDTMTVTFALE